MLLNAWLDPTTEENAFEVYFLHSQNRLFRNKSIRIMYIREARCVYFFYAGHDPYIVLSEYQNPQRSLTNGPLICQTAVVPSHLIFHVQALVGMKHNRHRGWRYLTIAMIVFLLGTGIFVLMKPIQQSKQLEQSLVEQFGWAPQYTPPADGFIPPGRVERFIRVRKAVQANCRIFQNIMDNVIKLETLESDPNLSASEKTSEGFDSLKKMFSAAPAFLEFMDARNMTLLSEGMGLGEYIYIYLAAYGEQLAQEPQGRYADQDEAFISRRMRREYVQILGNQLDALQATAQGTDSRVLIAELQAEMAALEDGSHVAPWPEGPPRKTAASLEPFSDQLSPLYCEGIVQVEVLQKNKGFNLEG